MKVEIEEYLKNKNGVHLINSVLMGGEFTLCGLAYDLIDSNNGGELFPTNKKVVTCPECIKIIKLCQGIKYNG